MILEIVRGFMGAGIITDSGIKMPIGNMIFNVGDPVYTDGEYAFGHSPERGKFINFIDNDIPMIEVFLTFEQGNRVLFNSLDYTSSFEQLGVLEDENVGNQNFIYSENMVASIEFLSSNETNIINKINIVKVDRTLKKEITQYYLPGEIDWTNCTDYYIDDNDDINIAFLATNENRDELRRVCYKDKVGLYDNYDYSSIVKPHIHAKLSEFENANFPTTLLTKTPREDITYNTLEAWEGDVPDLPGTRRSMVIPRGTKIDILETETESDYHCYTYRGDLRGGNFYEMYADLSFKRNIIKFKLNYVNITFVWDKDKKLYLGTCSDGGEGGHFTKENYPNGICLKAKFPMRYVAVLDERYIIKGGSFEIINKRQNAFIDENLRTNYKDFCYMEHNPIEKISFDNTGTEFKYQLTEKGWYLVGYKAFSGGISNCYLTKDEYKISIPNSFVFTETQDNICEVVECKDYILFQIQNPVWYGSDPIYCYVKETKSIINTGSMKKLSNRIKIKLDDYKKMLATLLAK